MSHRTVILSSFAEYLAAEHDSVDLPLSERLARDERLSRFPYSVMLQVSFAELDFANRWCWQEFGSSDGECTQQDSEYRVCDSSETHAHFGKWKSEWFAKTAYNFGFNEWYFIEAADRARFLANLININWGEHYPK